MFVNSGQVNEHVSPPLLLLLGTARNRLKMIDILLFSSIASIVDNFYSRNYSNY